MDAVQEAIIQAINESRAQIIDYAEDIYHHAEPGYREFHTAEKTAIFLQRLGIEVQNGFAITGLKGKLQNEKTITMAMVAELDGVYCPEHPRANPQNGLAHVCGHHCQLAAMVGAAIALSQEKVRSALGGNVVFFAVPSEEYTDLEYKENLMKQKKIRYGGGKSELIRIGAFDEIQLCLTHHVHMVDTYYDVLLGSNTTNGFICKKVQIDGKASHAAIAPHKGINALNAAGLALNALAYQRETYRDMDCVRVHTILTKGGGMVNVVPEQVTAEVQVRAKTMAAMLDASLKTNRSFEAGAHAIGAGLQIKDYPGYLPVLECVPQRPLVEAGKELKSHYKVGEIDPFFHNPASTDVGDLTHLMPVISFSTGGFEGALHSADFKITDPDLAYLLPAKIAALCIYNTLKNGAEEASKILEEFPQHLTKREYLEYMEDFSNN